ncbi:Hpt domain-containing protein [Sphingosinicella soli]|uniref:HPt (Histidine-containing phosphotransfer) domain-containing protein n=1 Tax=Sphingosinicella soli TaxID=333708 RepID=A0A7W7AZS1_9SPHN|nr:Hpt domain-containing protein [Sphingosinicella soli]MBB4630453.1 HPt (histidine-containing phosphotransfer) domain-containing protein [Sphingosinicella soli]
MNPESAPVFLPHRLLEITGGDTELFDDLMSEFRAHLPAYVGALRAAKDRAGWKAAAHRLKGAAQAIGAEAIGSIALLAELSAPGDSALLSRLDAEVARFSGTFR